MKLALSVVLLGSLTACSVHPLPEDVTKDNTLSIVKKVRCEAKETIKTIFLNVLAEDLNDHPSMAVHDRILNGNDDFTKANIDRLSPAGRARLKPWFDSGIGTTFVLTATEDDNGAASTKFTLPLTGDAFNISINAGKKLSRKNARSITLTEKWGGVAALDCSPDTVVYRNFLYPITGSVGMAEMITTYSKLRRDLTEQERPEALEKFSDKLTFTTELLGGVKPSLELKAVNEKFKLTSANGEFGGSRKDEHDVLIALSPPKPETEPLKLKLAENVTLTITVPKGKYTRGKPTQKTGQPSKSTVQDFDFDASPGLKDDLLRELNRLQLLDTNRQILDSIE